MRNPSTVNSNLGSVPHVQEIPGEMKTTDEERIPKNENKEELIRSTSPPPVPEPSLPTPKTYVSPQHSIVVGITQEDNEEDQKKQDQEAINLEEHFQQQQHQKELAAQEFEKTMREKEEFMRIERENVEQRRREREEREREEEVKEIRRKEEEQEQKKQRKEEDDAILKTEGMKKEQQNVQQEDTLDLIANDPLMKKYLDLVKQKKKSQLESQVLKSC